MEILCIKAALDLGFNVEEQRLQLVINRTYVFISCIPLFDMIHCVCFFKTTLLQNL